MRCPYCDAEVAKDDLFCGECGRRLPAAPPEGRGIATPLIIAIVAAVLVGCVGVGAAVVLLGIVPPFPLALPTPSPLPAPTSILTATLVPTSTPTPTPIVWLTYESAGFGISMRYPQDWFTDEIPDANQVVFAQEEEYLNIEPFLRGTSFVIAANSTAEVGMATAEAIVQYASGFLWEAYPDAQVGEMELQPIGGEEGARITIEGEFEQEGVSMRGWIAAAVANDYAYMLVAVAPVADWDEEGNTLQAMLDSLELFQPTPATPTAESPAPSPSTSGLVEPSPISGVDPYEPDDSTAQANPIAIGGTPQTHNLHVEGDHDYVSFVAESGTTYAIETLQLGSEIDTIISLYDGAGNQLTTDDDGADELRASYILWVAPSSGTYYVMIKDYGDDSAGADTTYGIRVLAEGVIEGN